MIVYPLIIIYYGLLVAILSWRAKASENLCTSLWAAKLSRDTIDPAITAACFDFASIAFAVMIPCAALYAGCWPFLAALPAIVVTLFPYALARHVMVPLGESIPAYWLALISRQPFGRFRVAGAVGISALAVLHQRHPSSLEVVRLEARLAAVLVTGESETLPGRRRSGDIGPAEAFVSFGAAFVSAVRGDLEATRLLFERLEQAGEDTCGPEVMRIALEWRCADAAERGDWKLIDRLVSAARSPGVTLRFLAAVGRCLEGRAALTGAAEMEALWRQSPDREKLRPLLDRARRPRPVVAHEHEESAMSPCQRALAMLACLCLERPEDPEGALQAFGSAWHDAMNDPGLSSRLLTRGATLGVADCDSLLTDLNEQVRQHVSALAHRDGVSLEALRSDAGLLRDAGASLRSARLRTLGQTLTALEQRWRADRRLSGHHEGLEVEAIFDQVLELTRFGDISDRRVVYAMLEDGLHRYAFWMSNKRRQAEVANRVFCFIATQGFICQDDGIYDVHLKNAALAC